MGKVPSHGHGVDHSKLHSAKDVRPSEDTYMVSSIGSSMSGMTLNDREITQSHAKKLSSHQSHHDYENTFDDREITGSGKYDFGRDDLDEQWEGELGEVVLEYTWMLTGKIMIPVEETKEPPMSPIIE